MALQRAWELHCRVPAEKWCITRHELQEFVQVNTYVVKPQTLAAGGMSYALMKHPQGLDCQVFVSHCWDGGIFHLNQSIHSAWPQLQRLRNLYCCLLANPQNLDINAFIGGDLMQSPFARALDRASHLLVVPNPTVAVYSRLWCVFEAYLGVQLDKTYLLPIKPSRPMVASFWCRHCGCYMVAGALVGLPLAWNCDDSRAASLHYLSVFFCFVSLIWQLLILPCSHSKFAMPITSFMSLCGGVLITLGLNWSLNRQTRMAFWLSFLHYGWMVNMTLFNCLVTVLLVSKIFEAKEFESKEEMMRFESLQMAHCTNQTDEQRIRDAIRGSEKEVETVIHILIRSGAYTDTLRRRWDAGISIQQKGSTDFSIAMASAILAWFFSAADCVSCALIYARSSSTSLCFAGLCLLLALLILIAVPQFQRRGPDQALIALRGWQGIGILSLQLPCILKSFGGDDIACTHWGHCFRAMGWWTLGVSIDWITLPVRGLCLFLAFGIVFFQGMYFDSFDLGCCMFSKDPSENMPLSPVSDATWSSCSDDESTSGTS